MRAQLLADTLVLSGCEVGLALAEIMTSSLGNWVGSTWS